MCSDENGQVTVASKEGCLMTLKEGYKIKEECLNLTGNPFQIIDLSKIGERFIIGSKNYFFLVEEDRLEVTTNKLYELEHEEAEQDIGYFMNVKEIIKSEIDELVILDYSKIYKFNKSGKNFLLDKTVELSAICQFYDKEMQQYFFVRKNEILVYNADLENIKTFSTETHPALFNDNIRYVNVHQKQLWIAYATGKLINFDLKSEQFQSYNLIGNKYINKLYFDEKDGLWILHEMGVTYIPNVNNIDQDSILYLNANTGLNSNDITDILAVDDLVYITSQKGINIFNFNSITNRNRSNVNFKSLKINGEIHDLEEKIFEHEQNNISILLESISYNLNRKSELHFKLIGSFDDWRKTELNEATFHALRPGKYEFIAKLLDKNTNHFSNEVAYAFEIKPVWWKTNGFKFLSALLFICLFILLDRIRTKRIKERTNYEIQIKKKFAMMRMRTLRAQLNPHFVYNALNSIQDYILDKDSLPALNYISMFSKLMRFYLVSSSESEIALDKELEHLKIYLELEKMRFRDKLTFEINIDPSLKIKNILIPPMLLQPFVENAILHGILPLKEGGTIVLNVEKSKSGFVCLISDNGIGFDNSKKLKLRKRVKRQSFGNSLVRERIELFNKSSKRKIDLKISSNNERLKGTSDSNSGTKVTLNFNEWF